MKIIFEDVIRVQLVKYVARRTALVKRPKVNLTFRLQRISQPFDLTLKKENLSLSTS
jgi:hypothetical protein